MAYSFEILVQDSMSYGEPGRNMEEAASLVVVKEEKEGASVGSDLLVSYLRVHCL